MMLRDSTGNHYHLYNKYHHKNAAPIMKNVKLLRNFALLGDIDPA